MELPTSHIDIISRGTGLLIDGTKALRRVPVTRCTFLSLTHKAMPAHLSTAITWDLELDWCQRGADSHYKSVERLGHKRS